MSSWFTRWSRRPSPAGPLGPLEWRVLECLWERPGPASVRDLIPGFPDTAYTTLMTTLDRLHRKGLLARSKRGRAFYYEPHLTRAELEAATAAAAFRTALESDVPALRPLLSFFVDALVERDQRLLSELESLVRARRSELRKKD